MSSRETYDKDPVNLRSHSKQYEPSSFSQPGGTKWTGKLNISDLIHATERSAALDLAKIHLLIYPQKLNVSSLTTTQPLVFMVL